MAGGAVAGALACPLYGDHAKWLDPFFPWGDMHHDKNIPTVGHATYGAAFVPLATNFGLLHKSGSLLVIAMLRCMHKSDQPSDCLLYCWLMCTCPGGDKGKTTACHSAVSHVTRRASTALFNAIFLPAA